MYRILPAFLVLLCTACGLAEDERDEENKYSYITISDPAFESYCLEHFDLNGDGRLSRYEAQRVLRMDCAGLGIASLSEIGEFSNLQRLDCGDNYLVRLDMSSCRLLRSLACGQNALWELNVDNLRSLTSLRCENNRLGALNLRSGVSISTLDCSNNELVTLDVSVCAGTMDFVNAKGNSSLTTLYKGAAQDIRVLQVDSQTTVVER